MSLSIDEFVESEKNRDRVQVFFNLWSELRNKIGERITQEFDEYKKGLPNFEDGQKVVESRFGAFFVNLRKTFNIKEEEDPDFEVVLSLRDDEKTRQDMNAIAKKVIEEFGCTFKLVSTSGPKVVGKKDGTVEEQLAYLLETQDGLRKRVQKIEQLLTTVLKLSTITVVAAK